MIGKKMKYQFVAGGFRVVRGSRSCQRQAVSGRGVCQIQMAVSTDSSYLNSCTGSRELHEAPSNATRATVPAEDVYPVLTNARQPLSFFFSVVPCTGRLF